MCLKLCFIRGHKDEYNSKFKIQNSKFKRVTLEDVLKVCSSVSNLCLPHPNPPLIKGREQDFLFPHFLSYGVYTSL
jgi:hypothetical protein